MQRIVKSSTTSHEVYHGQHRSEHWYVDNQVYFITARCRDRYPAFASEQAKGIFWDRFDHYAAKYGFQTWVVTLLDNHYHFEGYLPVGRNLGPMMRQLHGSVAKLVNDVLEAQSTAGAMNCPRRVPGVPGVPGAGAMNCPRRVPFWRESKRKDYFDGCIRDEKQCRLSCRYTMTQAERHGICDDHRDYPHTRVLVDLEQAIRFAHEKKAFMEGVPYKRYLKR
ncbi:MAG: hypothetical protein WC058_08385 [Phycisphaeraceae bacterium]